LPEVQFFFSVGWARNPILSLSLSLSLSLPPHTPNNPKKKKRERNTLHHCPQQNPE
jgi:hypothetical protein